MFLAHRTKQRLRFALLGCVAYALAVAIVSAVLPREGQGFAHTFGWGLVAIPTGLALYAACEMFGTWGLGLPFWQRMPSWARVSLLVLLIGVGVVAALLLRQHFDAA